MDDEPLIYRDEVLIIMWTIGDIAVAARRFVELVGGEGGEQEEEEPEDE